MRTVAPAGHDAPSGPQNGPQRAMSEKALMEAVIEAAGYLGYRSYHTHDSRRSTAGFPDLVLLRERDGRRFAIECKAATGTPTPAQLGWLAAFAACGIPAMVIRPADLDWLLEVLK